MKSKKYKIIIKGAVNIPESTIKYIVGLTLHNLTGYGTTLTSKNNTYKFLPQKLTIPKICKKCKNFKHHQCWCGDHYNDDFDGDYDVCFEPKNKRINKDKVIQKYWENYDKWYNKMFVLIRKIDEIKDNDDDK